MLRNNADVSPMPIFRPCATCGDIEKDPGPSVVHSVALRSLPGPSRRLAPVIKCNAFLSFQSYIVRDISLTEIYRWLVTFGSVRRDLSLVIEILSAIFKSTRYGGE